MTVDTTIAYARTQGDGVTTVYAVDFPLQEADQLTVELVTVADGAVTAQTLDTHYTLVIADDGASADVTMLVAPSSSYWVVRRRNARYLQPDHLPAHGPLPSETIEAALDRLTFDMQAIRDTMFRGIRLSDSDPVFDATLPSLASLLGKYIFINGSGDPIGTDGPAGVAVSAALEAFVQAASLQAALEILPLAVKPQGRLTLTTGVPVMTGSVSGAGTVYYTTGLVPIYDGVGFRLRTLAVDLSNVLANSATGNAGPAAVVPNANYDCYLWRSGTTNYLTRSDYWKKASTVTMTIASPCVVSWGATAPADGTPVVLTTTGALATGLVAGTTYFAKAPSGSSSNLSATVGGAAINTTGAQSGVHTATAGDDSGGVARAAAGNCELQRVAGLLTNKNAITNGPGANLGAFVGTIRTNSAGTVDWIRGGSAEGGTAAVLGVWNMYNRVDCRGLIGDTTDTWSYSSSNIRPANNSATMRVSWVMGLQEDYFTATYYSVPSGATASRSGVGLDATNAFTGRLTAGGNITNVNYLGVGGTDQQLLGFHFISACEQSDGASTTFTGDNGGTVQWSGLQYQGRF